MRHDKHTPRAHVTHLRPAAAAFELERRSSLLAWKMLQELQVSKSDNGGETEPPSQHEELYELSLTLVAAGEQALQAAHSGPSRCHRCPPSPHPHYPEQAPSPPDHLGKEGPLQVRLQRYPASYFRGVKRSFCSSWFDYREDKDRLHSHKTCTFCCGVTVSSR